MLHSLRFAANLNSYIYSMENMVKEVAVKYNWISPKEYLSAERLSEEKHEYFEGEVIVMQGASLKHNRIVSNLLREAGNKLRGKTCEILPGDMRTASPDFLSYMYPDASIVCRTPQLSDNNFDVLQVPIVVIEVISKSSQGDDCGRKWMYYRQIPSLQQYVLINSFKKVQVDIYRRNLNNTWILESYYSLENILQLQSVGISIILSEIYDNVTFETLKADIDL